MYTKSAGIYTPTANHGACQSVFELARPLEAGFYQSNLARTPPAFGLPGRGALLYVVSGQGLWSIGTWSGPIRRGDWLAVPSGAIPSVRTEASNSFAYYYAIFDLAGLDPDQSHQRLSWPWPLEAASHGASSAFEPCIPDAFKAEIAMLFRQLQNELLRHHRPGAAVAARAHMAVLGVVFERLRSERARSPGIRKARRASGPYPRAMPEPLAQALDFLDANLNRELSLADLARASRYSERRFVQIFRRFLGVSPMAYVRERRVKEAQRLLSGGGLTVKEIAARLNFADAQHLSRVFRQVTGISPTEFTAGAPSLRQRESGYFVPSTR